MPTHPVIIIGSGLAGYTLAREFRKLDKLTPMTLLTTDDGSAYSKPMLSNALAKGLAANEIANADAKKMSQQLDATIHINTAVTSIDPQENTICIEGQDKPQQTLQFSNLVFAVGAEQIQLPIAGNAADQTISVNDLTDYALFRERINDAKKVAIIGGGLIGCEFANDLTKVGIQTQVIELNKHPLLTLLPELAAEALQTALTDTGIEWHLQRSITAINHDINDNKLKLSLTSSHSDDISINDIDLVLSAIGLRPRTALAKACGINSARGIIVDSYLKTNFSNIYALGDCAEVCGLILPYVMPLMNSARSLAKTLANQPTKVIYPPMPIMVKTPALAIIVLPPPAGLSGQWKSTEIESGTKSLYIDENDAIRGFALTGEAIKERAALTKEVPPLLSE